MPHYRTSSLFSAFVGLVGVVGGAAALALAGPAAAAPIPLPHHWSEAGLVGAGHHVADPRTPGGPGLAPGGPGLTPGSTPSRAPWPALATGPRSAADRAGRDHLTVTVHQSGSARTDGTFELYCHPGGGNHPHVKAACAKLDGMARWGRDPFAPVPQGANCTMMYGGPALAHITGTWAGRPVNADFRRTNGCEISRWGHFEPLLPSTRS
ncbi:SSI family serine proteinase inhibitor [Streptomyces kronopolitis]|uniref:SSI family serine proteinase inhibitor n=1 Tax=Streptomyces kronopolitis TaxID=1612435 RepID=UPI0020BF6F7A|nr:SSI family serine proteinase inhibitor [Streptomyces kronopolitis]MCL6299838.1 subtilase-type protease inhibitor [Streptomyces kronopolitis]